ncbi:5-formyltetrahydrofolate cyclo-ligase [Ammonifex thiophilus]|uniref:5-formyltetrahydrofolate cyclo-ligase n=1 Tax=Ammonifex thiophilus TaxID=444093 RepID=A0A3D8P517_9THEO|nr:5-formyltetrahydrofolate cyclo-ligase [Ammonifex thiophilus]RDV84333.1 5-formyltetrahydrofolate cyclo-ligase [Ammonifex thiophilus]
MKKESLRQVFLRKRLALPPEEVAWAGERVAELFFSLPAYRQAKTLLLYCAFRQEVPTKRIISASLAEGKLVALPATSREKKEITARLIKVYPDDLVPGPGGIPEPRPTCPSVPPEEIDLVAVPGLVFDLKGYRLGYGWGCYDRFLSRSPALRVGLAYDFQVVEDVGAEPHDQRLHFLITPSRIYRFDEVEVWEKRS